MRSMKVAARKFSALKISFYSSSVDEVKFLGINNDIARIPLGKNKSGMPVSP